MMQDHAPGDVVQALMDLGAMICRPKEPRCGECPLRTHCRAFASGEPESFPERKQRKARPHRYGVAFWTVRDGHVWLVRRPPSGLLGGMAALQRVGAVGVERRGVDADELRADGVAERLEQLRGKRSIAQCRATADRLARNSRIRCEPRCSSFIEVA